MGLNQIHKLGATNALGEAAHAGLSWPCPAVWFVIAA
jgi:hypothetical protein